MNVFSLDQLASLGISAIEAPCKNALDVAALLVLWALNTDVLTPQSCNMSLIHIAKLLDVTPI